MGKLNTWFVRLPATQQKLLKGNAWALAEAAWAGALEDKAAELAGRADAAHSKGDYKERDRLRDAAALVASP